MRIVHLFPYGSAYVLFVQAACDTSATTPDVDPGPARDEIDAVDVSGFALWDAAVVRDVYVEVAEEDWDTLDDDPEAEVPAAISFGGDPWMAGLKRKGTTSPRALDEKPTFSIDLRAYDPEAPLLDGVRRLTLDDIVQDPTIPREHTAHALHAALGVPTPRHVRVRLWVNGEWLGVYGLIETMDERFVGRTWPCDAEGNLHESEDGVDAP